VLANLIENAGTQGDAAKEEFMDFILSMARVAAEDRLTAEELLKHKWLTNEPST
jgi:hypothetical protein